MQLRSTEGLGPRALARLAGAFYLLNILAGAFALGYVPAVAPAIGDNQTLFRAGLAAHLLVTLTNPPLALLFYELFKVVNRRLALLTVFFGLVATAIEAASVFDPVAHPVVPAYDVYTAFFAFDVGILGYLTFSSGFLPRLIGVLLAVDGASYLIYAFVDISSPGLAAHLVPWSQLPILAGEGSLCLWLLIAGVKVPRPQVAAA